MTKKETIIKAITEMDINLLDVVLDNESYMDVPKELFLERLEKEFQNLKEKGISSFEKVYKGTCTECFKGSDGLTFLTKNNDSLDLIFFEENDEIKDIFRCSRFNNDEDIKNKNTIYLSFKEDEKIDFKPSIDLIIKQGKTDLAEEKFEKFKNTVTDLDTILIWLEESKYTHDSLNLSDRLDYNAFSGFFSKYTEVQSVEFLKEYHQESIRGIEDYNKSNMMNEDERLNWVIKYENAITNIPTDLNVLEKHAKNNFILLSNNVIVDIRKYKESIELLSLFKNLP